MSLGGPITWASSVFAAVFAVPIPASQNPCAVASLNHERGETHDDPDYRNDKSNQLKHCSLDFAIEDYARITVGGVMS